MDSLANYGSDGDNSNNSDDLKMPFAASREIPQRRSSDANYDPVQMDMSEESNNNNSSENSGSERTTSPTTQRQPAASKTDSSRRRSSPADQRRSDHDSHSSNSRDDHKRVDRTDRRRRSRDDRSKSRRSSHDDKRHRDSDHGKDYRESKKSRDDDRKYRDDDRRRDRRASSSSCKDDRSDERDRSGKDHHYRDDRRDRGRDRSDRDYRRDRDRRYSRDEKTKDRRREERPSREHKEKGRTRSRSRSKDRPPPQPFRTMSYREEKGRNKLAQLEKLGIELKLPTEPIIPMIPGEPNYYNPLATATQGKYAEQIQKRKLLWANKSKQEEGKAAVATASAANTWMGTTFTHDQDGKVTAKFKRLMGIKGDTPVIAQPGQKPDILKKQEEMFNNMEQQYEVARATTHTQRGVGLGYASGGYQFPR